MVTNNLLMLRKVSNLQLFVIQDRNAYLLRLHYLNRVNARLSTKSGSNTGALGTADTFIFGAT